MWKNMQNPIQVTADDWNIIIHKHYTVYADGPTLGYAGCTSKIVIGQIGLG